MQNCEVCKKEADCSLQLSEHGKPTVYVCSYDCGLKCLNNKKLLEKIQKEINRRDD